MQTPSLVHPDLNGIRDVFGPTVVCLSPSEAAAVYGMMRGTIPTGVAVPLHSHCYTSIKINRTNMLDPIPANGAFNDVCFQGSRPKTVLVKVALDRGDLQQALIL